MNSQSVTRTHTLQIFIEHIQIKLNYAMLDSGLSEYPVNANETLSRVRRLVSFVHVGNDVSFFCI